MIWLKPASKLTISVLKQMTFQAVLLATLSSTTWAAEWTVESEIISVDEDPHIIEVSGNYLFMRANNADISRRIDIYERSAGNWEFVQTLYPYGLDRARNFGNYISIHEDEALILMSPFGIFTSTTEDSNTEDSKLDTAVAVYSRTTSGWRLTDFLPILSAVPYPVSDREPSVQNVVLTRDYAAVTFYYVVFNEQDNNYYLESYVAVFEKIGNQWQFMQRLTVPDLLDTSLSQIEFGFNLEMSKSSLAVSTVPYYYNLSGTSFGSVYMYNLKKSESNDQAEWTFDRRFDQAPGYGNASFGAQIDLTENGMLVTATKLLNSPEPEALAAYLYRKDDNGNWQEDAVFRTGDEVLTNALTDFYAPSPTEPFIVDAATLVDDRLFIFSTGFEDIVSVGVGFERLHGEWVPDSTILRPSANVNSLSFRSSYSDDSLLFLGTGQTNTNGTSNTAALIEFDLDCSSNKSLPDNQWISIAPPCLPADNPPTVAELFADDFNSTDVYNEDWAVFRFDQNNYNYVLMTLDEPMVRGVGYWMIQSTGKTIQLDTPNGSSATTLNTDVHDVSCVDTAKGCISNQISMFTQPRDGFRMSGNPLNANVDISDLRFVTEHGHCVGACNLTEAHEHQIAANTLYRYSTGPAYDQLTIGDQIEPWDGFWLGTFSQSNDPSPSLVFPKSN